MSRFQLLPSTSETFYETYKNNQIILLFHIACTEHINIMQSNMQERRYVCFDGDVDALWIENMNSVMDDNKLLTLANGERIRLNSYCALLFEVNVHSLLVVIIILFEEMNCCYWFLCVCTRSVVIVYKIFYLGG